MNLTAEIEHVIKGLVEVVANLLDLELLLEQIFLHLTNNSYTKGILSLRLKSQEHSYNISVQGAESNIDLYEYP